MSEEMKVIEPTPPESGPADSTESPDGVLFTMVYEDQKVEPMNQKHLPVDKIKRVVIQIDMEQLGMSPGLAAIGTKLLRGHLEEVKVELLRIIARMKEVQAKKSQRIITRDTALSQMQH